MKKQEILSAIESLAHSQGFYGRLYEAIHNNEEALQYLENQDFKDIVDMIIFMES